MFMLTLSVYTHTLIHMHTLNYILYTHAHTHLLSQSLIFTPYLLTLTF